MGSILSSSTSNSGFPSPSLLNTNEFLEMLMLPDSGLTRNTDHLWALLRPNTWPSFFTGLSLKKKSLHSCSPSAVPPWLMEPGGTVTFCLCYIQRNQKNLFFAKKILWVVCLFSNCNILFPYPKETWCLELLLICMKKTF